MPVIVDAERAAFVSFNGRCAVGIASSNDWPCAAIVPVDFLLDTSRRQECIDIMTRQFAALPAEDLSDEFLRASGAANIVSIVNHIGYTQGMEAAINVVNDIFSCFPEEAVRINSMLRVATRENIQAVFDAITATCTTGFPRITREQRAEVFEKISGYIIPNPVEGPEIATVKAVWEMQHNPATAAERCYELFHANGVLDGLEQDVSLQGIYRTHEYRVMYDKALACLPRKMAQYIQFTHTPIVMMKEGDINKVIPGNDGAIGIATWSGVLLEQKDYVLLAEELAHKAEHSCLVYSRYSPRYAFGLYDTAHATETAWPSLLLKDLTEGRMTNNFAYKRVLRDYAEFSQPPHHPKSNTALVPDKVNDLEMRIDAALKELSLIPEQWNDVCRDVTEAIPDLIRMAEMVRQQLEVRKVIPAGDSFGDGVYTDMPSFMQAAFPRAWESLNGAEEGYLLVQNMTTGAVTKVLEDDVVKWGLPTNTTRVRSLPDYCEEAAKEVGMRIAAERVRNMQERVPQSAIQGDAREMVRAVRLPDCHPEAHHSPLEMVKDHLQSYLRAIRHPEEVMHSGFTVGKSQTRVPGQPPVNFRQ